MPDTIETSRSTNDTPARAILGSIARGALKVAGSALVTRGAMDQGTVDGVIPMAAEMLVGATMVGVGQGWGLFRAWFSHTRFAGAIKALEQAQPAS